MKENSIKEDIKIVENYLANSAINETDSDFFKNGGWETVDLEIPKSMQHILSDYKRVLKENETYQKSDYETICLENNELREMTDRIQSEYNDLLKDNFKLKNELETKRKEYQETYKDVREELKELRKENEELRKYIAIAPNLDEMTAIKYRNIQRDAYIQGRAEEQQRAEQIIYENYIPVQKIKDKIETLEKVKEKNIKRNFDTVYKDGYFTGGIDSLQELLDNRK